MDELQVSKRLRYFNHQFLRDLDFIDEQEYHLKRRRLHNRLLHAHGVARGLKILAQTDSVFVTVQSGVAIDQLGQEIVLTVDKTVNLSSYPGGNLYVTITYAERTTDPATDDPAAADTDDRDTRWIEDPKISASATEPDSSTGAVVLGIVKRSSEGKITSAVVDYSKTPTAGAIGGSMSLEHLRLSKGDIGEPGWVRMRLEASRLALVEGSLHVADSITVDKAAEFKSGLTVSAGLASFTGGLTVPAGQSDGALKVTAGGQVSFAGLPNLPPKFGNGLVVENGTVSFATTPSFDNGFNVKGGSVFFDTGFSVQAGPVNFSSTGSPIFWNGLDVRSGTVSLGSGVTVKGGTARFETGLQVVDGSVSFGTGFTVTKGPVSFMGGPQSTRPTFGNGLAVTSGDLELKGGGKLQISGGDIEVDAGHGMHSNGRLLLTANESICLLPDVALGAVYVGYTPPPFPTTAPPKIDLHVSGKLHALDGKGGYVVDQFVNRLGDALEQGDVVVLHANGTSGHYGSEGQIPVPEVDLTEQAYDARVCGIVEAVLGEMAEVASGGAGDGDPTVLAPRIFDGVERAALDTAKIQPGQVGGFVTLGAYRYCKVDADIAPIVPGDLLTTSPTKGHAQKVLERDRATGATIGKALGGLDAGKGMIPVLVNLH